MPYSDGGYVGSLSTNDHLGAFVEIDATSGKTSSVYLEGRDFYCFWYAVIYCQYNQLQSVQNRLPFVPDSAIYSVIIKILTKETFYE